MLHKFCHNLKEVLNTHTHTNTSYGDVTGYVLGTSRDFQKKGSGSLPVTEWPHASMCTSPPSLFFSRGLSRCPKYGIWSFHGMKITVIK